jgi:hypothetical protein
MVVVAGTFVVQLTVALFVVTPDAAISVMTGGKAFAQLLVVGVTM